MISPRTITGNKGAVLTALVIVAPVSVHAQQERTLGPPDATYEEPFSLVGAGNVRELSDGRLIVADPRDKLLQVIDLEKGSSVAIGREGSGPAEFGMPMRLFDAPRPTPRVACISRRRASPTDRKGAHSRRTRPPSSGTIGGPSGWIRWRG